MAAAPERLTTLALLFAVFAVAAGSSSPSQADALLAWRLSLGDPEAALSSWTNATTVCYGWRGIACDVAGNVKSLRIRDAGLTGTLDPAALPALSILDLDGNNLTGGIPASFSRFGALAKLHLGNNYFAGAIPPMPPTLVSLSLYLNSFQGGFPAESVLRSTKLRYLDLSLNSFAGTIPNALPEKLRYLNVSANSLSGRIPPSLVRLTRLRDLRLASNNFTGGVPEFLGSMSRLRILELRRNPLGERLPAGLGRLHRLQRLDINGAGLVSTLPPELGELRNLVFMDLSINGLSGGLPASFAGMARMREFGISSNYLTGDIPGILFASWPQLVSFQVHNNTLTGKVPLPPEVGRAIKLKILFLFSNNLTGPIPPEVGELAELQQLDLALNFLTGPIPSSFGRLKQLTTLSLFCNELTGPIPLEIGNMTSLRRLDVNTNNLHGHHLVAAEACVPLLVRQRLQRHPPRLVTATATSFSLVHKLLRLHV
ncbi:unnamed protein product [Urochloa humidicola]